MGLPSEAGRTSSVHVLLVADLEDDDDDQLPLRDAVEDSISAGRDPKDIVVA